MRFLTDLRTGESPVTLTARAIGSDPVWSSQRWDQAGVEIAHWEIEGPHQFRYGEQPCHGIAFVHSPLSHHLLMRNNKTVREGRVFADRFRVSTPGDMIGAQVTTADTIRMTHLYFSSIALETLAQDMAIPEAPLHLNDPSWDRRSQAIETLLRLLYNDVRGSRTPDWARLEQLALYAVSTMLRQDEPARTRERRISKRVERAIAFIETNLDQPIGLTEIAAAACVSRFHLCRLFRDETGTTPRALLQEHRSTKAKQLLSETSLGLDEIAYQTGFASAASLSGALRRRFGCGPSELRRG